MTYDEILTAARSWIGKINAYQMGADSETVSDCSAFMWRVLGGKKDQSGLWWGTDRIWTDVTGAQTEFERLDVAVPGCIAVYPGHTTPDGVRHAGHVGFVVDPATHLVVDCSSSGGGVKQHAQPVFWSGSHPVVFARYKAFDPDLQGPGIGDNP